MFAFLYPSIPFDIKNTDPEYESEKLTAQNLGFTVANIDIEELNDNKLKLSKQLDPNTTVIYRGWMLKPEIYKVFEILAINKGLAVLTNQEQYISSHYINGWYPSIEHLTFRTVFQEGHEGISELLEHSGFHAYFIKDFVKSLTTSRGSIAMNKKEVFEIVDELISKRGEIEKGLCVREFVPLKAGMEERYFVLNGKSYARNGIVPDIVLEAAKLHKAPFFSVDVTKTQEGKDIIVEIGDGQVSDVKLWHFDNFYQMFKQ